MKLRPAALVREYWDANAREYRASHPEHHDQVRHPSWGLAHIPEAELRLLPDDHTGVLVEVGCGPGHDAAGFARLGYRVVAIDLSLAQVAGAVSHDALTYVVGDAARLPLADDVVDAIVSDHGAFDHADPTRLLNEAARVLRPGGLLVICTYSPLALSCFDSRLGRITDRLSAPYPNNRLRTDGTIVTVSFSHAAMVRMLTTSGFRLERMEEPVLDEDGHTYFDELVSDEWARTWPVDTIWVARRGSIRGTTARGRRHA